MVHTAAYASNLTCPSTDHSLVPHTVKGATGKTFMEFLWAVVPKESWPKDKHRKSVVFMTMVVNKLFALTDMGNIMRAHLRPLSADCPRHKHGTS